MEDAGDVLARQFPCPINVHRIWFGPQWDSTKGVGIARTIDRDGTGKHESFDLRAMQFHRFDQILCATEIDLHPQITVLIAIGSLQCSQMDDMADGMLAKRVGQHVLIRDVDCKNRKPRHIDVVKDTLNAGSMNVTPTDNNLAGRILQ